MSLKTFAVRDEQVYSEYTAILKRNQRKIADDLDAYMRDVIKNHSTGNDQFKIDQWVSESDMKAVPAFNSKRETWQKYLPKLNPKELDEFKIQLEKISKSIPLTIEKPKESNEELKIYDGFIPRDEYNKGKQALNKKVINKKVM